MHRIIGIVLLMVSLATVKAGDTTLDRATLKGLKAVNVVVDPLDPQLEEQGLTADMLRDRVEQRLRKASIQVDQNAVEFVGLHVTSMQSGKTPYSLCFAIGLYQPVVLARDAKVRTASPTWSVMAILVVPAKPLVDSALRTADQLTDVFGNAYRSVNAE